MKNAKIYGLVDPEGVVRDVGKTEQSLERRLQQHWSEARSGKRNHRCNWLRTLSGPPKIVLIEEVAFQERQEWETREIYWIALFRDYGHNLVNGTIGGESVMSGQKHTAEARAKISVATAGKNNPNFGKTHSLETRARISAAKVGKPGRPHTLETREKIGAAQRGEKNHMNGRTGEQNPSFGKRLSPETRAKIRAAKIGKPGHPHTLETREKLRTARLGDKNPMFGVKSPMQGKKHTPEAREKQRQAALRRYHGV